ncbi:MAG: alpha/beta fold hydrolase [Phycisphaeraceae bacterium]|nr:alpha/beta fold hydrolase [Phycisphaeraceae bacterium]
MPTQQIEWTLPGADRQPILGTTHVPFGGLAPFAVLILAHGFKGYKDYGFIPYLAESAARRGMLALRFNFSHAGMANNIATFDRLHMFERPDLFERDTWGRQIEDLQLITAATRQARVPGIPRPNLPVVYFGHSRGGITSLLTAWRLTMDPAANPPPAAVITAAAPDDACGLSETDKIELRARGFVESPSTRTGQVLRVGRQWLAEIEANPKAFNPLQAIATLACPCLVIHGEHDPTVPLAAAHRLAQAGGAKTTLRIIAGANHTFNASNPMSLEGQTTRQTSELTDTVCTFAAQTCRG